MARAAHVVRESVAPAPVAKKEVPTVSGFRESFMTYSKTNNKPSAVYAKEGMLNAHLIPFFGKMRLDAIGPAEIEKYKAAELDSGLLKKSINNHLTALRKLLNLAVEWNVLDRAPKVRGFREKHEYVAEDEYLTFEETTRFMELREPPRHAGRLAEGRAGAGARVDRDDPALLASHAGREARGGPVARLDRNRDRSPFDRLRASGTCRAR